MEPVTYFVKKSFEPETKNEKFWQNNSKMGLSTSLKSLYERYWSINEGSAPMN